MARVSRFLAPGDLNLASFVAQIQMTALPRKFSGPVSHLVTAGTKGYDVGRKYGLRKGRNNWLKIENK